MTSTNALSALPSSLASLLNRYAQSSSDSSSSSSTSTAATVAGGALGEDPAYTLTLSNKQSGAALVGYNQLAQLGTSFKQQIAELGQGTATSSKSVSVTVTQLAQAQSLQSSSFGDPDGVSLGTGSLTIETGKVDATSGTFKTSGSPVTITVGSGSLNDIAKAINAAKAGITATVVEENGGYALSLTGGKTGAAQAFRLSGQSELAYDPASPTNSALTTTAAASDAHYSIDGTAFSYGSNSGVPVAFGTTTNFTKTGSLSVPVSSSTDALQSLVSAFNSLQGSIRTMADTNGSLVSDVNLAAGMFKSLGDAATGTVAGDGTLSSLADLGVSVNKDGSLSIDSSTLAAALSSDPTGAQTVISQVATAMKGAVDPYLGKDGSIDSQIGLLASLAVRGPGLFDYLNGTASDSWSGSLTSSLADYLTSDSSSSGSSTKTLADYLNASDSSSSATTTGGASLLSLLG